jgi:uncharacterized protein YndB with AHSA1/START domain
MTDLTVNIEKIINAPIEKVFDAWLNPKMLSKFMMGMPGMAETDVEIDAREGGHFTFIMHIGDEKIPHTGKYLAVCLDCPLLWDVIRALRSVVYPIYPRRSKKVMINER